MVRFIFIFCCLTRETTNVQNLITGVRFVYFRNGWEQEDHAGSHCPLSHLSYPSPGRQTIRNWRRCKYFHVIQSGYHSSKYTLGSWSTEIQSLFLTFRNELLDKFFSTKCVSTWIWLRRITLDCHLQDSTLDSGWV